MTKTNNILNKEIRTQTNKKKVIKIHSIYKMSSTLLDFGDKFITKFGELLGLLRL